MKAPRILLRFFFLSRFVIHDLWTWFIKISRQNISKGWILQVMMKVIKLPSLGKLIQHPVIGVYHFCFHVNDSQSHTQKINLIYSKLFSAWWKCNWTNFCSYSFHNKCLLIVAGFFFLSLCSVLCSEISLIPGSHWSWFLASLLKLLPAQTVQNGPKSKDFGGGSVLTSDNSSILPYGSVIPQTVLLELSNDP